MFVVVIFAVFLGSVHSANILGVFMYPSISHQLLYHKMMKELSLRGHQVTVVTPDPMNDTSLTNLKEVNIHLVYDYFQNKSVESIFAQNISFATIMMRFYKFLDLMVEKELSSPDFQNLLSDKNQNFDLIIIELMHPVFYALSHKYNAPIIGIMSMSIYSTQYNAVGNPNHPILYPEHLLNLIPGKLTLWEKIRSSFFFLFNNLYYHYIFLPRADDIARKYFGDIPRIGDLEKNVSMYFVNRNWQIPGPRANVPAVVEILPIGVDPPKALPQDLQKFLDSAKKGVIYFSMGTSVRMTHLNTDLKKEMLETVRELPYHVLFKWENHSFPEMPENVMVRSWFPQKDVLAHKNIKTFVTQGGLQSLEEAISREVPMVVIPFYADQPENARRVEELGIGEKLGRPTVTKNKLKELIIKVAETQSYKSEIKKTKAIFFDTPMTGLENVVWWTEYVIRYKGAQHLRSPSADITLFEYLLLDVWAVLLTVTLMSFYAFYKLLSYVIIVMDRQKKQKGKAKKNK